jgi:hypothetical protein
VAARGLVDAEERKERSTKSSRPKRRRRIKAHSKERLLSAGMGEGVYAREGMKCDSERRPRRTGRGGQAGVAGSQFRECNEKG